jgi:hypothetical protein
MPEHFHSVQIIDLGVGNTRAGFDIYFERAQNPPQPDPAVEALRREYEETMFVVKNVDMTQEEFLTTTNQLVAGAKVGLVGPNFSLDSGKSALSQLKAALVRKARGRRDAYLIRLALTGLVVTLLTLALAGAAYFIVPKYLTDTAMTTVYQAATAWLVPAILLHPGVVLGVVFVAFVANRTLTFDKLLTFDPYYFSPLLRFVYVSVISYVMLAALWKDFVMLGVGGYLLNTVKQEPGAGFAIGLICGLGEAAVVELLLSRLKPVERNST